MRIYSLVSLLLPLVVGTGVAQQPRTVPVAAIIGTVLDSATGEVPPRGQICYRAAYGLSRCSPLNKTGEYVVDRLPLTDYTVAISCFNVVLPVVATITIDTAAQLRRDWKVSTARCDHRPLRSVTREFRGHFSWGFEESSFVPCPGDEWVLPSDALPLRTDAWADLRRGVDYPRVRRPKGDTTDAAIYVRWHATVEGPGAYGHLGMSRFGMTVDKILEARWPAPDDCKRGRE